MTVRFFLIPVLSAAFFLFSSLSTTENLGAEPFLFEQTGLVVVTQTARITMTVELARTPDQRAQGLQFRQNFRGLDGMLFDFGETQPVTMWMKNTLISLDMLFIDEKGVIKHIAKKTTPLSLDHIPSQGPVLAVLEIGAGRTEALNIRIGDRIEHAIFKSAH